MGKQMNKVYWIQVEGESSWLVSFFVVNRLKQTFYQRVLKKYHTKPKHALIEAGVFTPVTKSNVNDLTKGVKNGLTKIIWQDDSQVVSMMVRKFYSMTPRVEVSISYSKEDE